MPSRGGGPSCSSSLEPKKVASGPPDQEVVVPGLAAVGASPDDPEPPTKSGVLQPIAAKVLMKILYGARMARYDLLRAVCHAASCITKWTEQQYMDLFRLICFIKSTSHYRMTAWDRMDGG